MSRTLLSPEARVLLLALRPEGQLDRLAMTLQEPRFDWNLLLLLAQKENATSVLWSALRALSAGLPAERARQFSQLAQITEFRMHYLEQRLLQSLDAFSAAQIDVVLLKGAALGATVYGAFTVRQMGDLDLLVRHHDAKRAWELMRNSGWVAPASHEHDEFYETHHHLVALEDPKPTGVGLELHTEIAPSIGAAHLPAQAIWERARRIELKGRSTLVPCTEHQILHIAIHFAWSHMMTSAAWRTFRDLHQITSTSAVDWDEVVRLAVQTRARTCCYWTLRLAQSIFTDLLVPREVLHALRPPLPEPILGLLHRHFVGSLFPLNPRACPSVRLGELLWNAGVAPRWSGHSDVRPWHRSEAWFRQNLAQAKLEARATPTSTTTEPAGSPTLLPNAAVQPSTTRPSLSQRFKHFYARARCWSRYLGVMLTPDRHQSGIERAQRPIPPQRPVPAVIL